MADESTARRLCRRLDATARSGDVWQARPDGKGREQSRNALHEEKKFGTKAKNGLCEKISIEHELVCGAFPSNYKKRSVKVLSIL